MADDLLSDYHRLDRAPADRTVERRPRYLNGPVYLETIEFEVLEPFTAESETVRVLANVPFGDPRMRLKNPGFIGSPGQRGIAQHDPTDHTYEIYHFDLQSKAKVS